MDEPPRQRLAKTRKPKKNENTRQKESGAEPF